MKRAIRVLIVFLLLALVGTSLAWPHAPYHRRHHARVGVFIGAPVVGPWYYRAPVYYVYPPIVAVPASPPVYIEQGSIASTDSQEPGNWWYYCQDSQSYYPYVKECPRGWLRVAPRPPDMR